MKRNIRIQKERKKTREIKTTKNLPQILFIKNHFELIIKQLISEKRNFKQSKQQINSQTKSIVYIQIINSLANNQLLTNNFESYQFTQIRFKESLISIYLSSAI
ncbi:hypothetical protein ABPG73_005075 [Tetrahymena malaccensis]